MQQTMELSCDDAMYILSKIGTCGNTAHMELQRKLMEIAKA